MSFWDVDINMKIVIGIGLICLFWIVFNENYSIFNSSIFIGVKYIFIDVYFMEVVFVVFSILNLIINDVFVY